MRTKDKVDLPGAEAILAEHITTGQHCNPARDWQRLWTTAYLHDPHELADEARATGFTVRALLAVEGPAKLLPDLAERLQHPRRRVQVLDALRRLEDQPSVLGTSEHVLVVATPAARPHTGEDAR